MLQVLPDKGRVVVQGVNFIKRHTRPNPQRNIKGGIATGWITRKSDWELARE